jgi:hypothetical protein
VKPEAPMSAPAGGGDASPPAPPSPDASASAGGPPPAMGAPAASPDASAAPMGDPAMQGDPAMEQGPVDPAALAAEYAKLPLDELQIHYEALKQAIMQKLGPMDGAGAPGAGAPSPDASAGGPPPAAGGEASPPPSAPAGDASPPPSGGDSGPPSDGGGDDSGSDKDEGEKKSEGGMEKSESMKAIEAMQGQVTELKAVVETLVKAVTTVPAAKPARKAVEGLSQMKKSEGVVSVDPSNRSEVIKHLTNVVTKRSDLKKSDRAAIDAYCARKVGFEKIQHLFDSSKG